MDIFEELQKAGEGLISFIQGGLVNAVIIGIASFIAPINIIIWLLILYALYKRPKR